MTSASFLVDTDWVIDQLMLSVCSLIQFNLIQEVT